MDHFKCPNCQSKRIHKLESFKNHYLSKCQQCNFVFAYQIPSVRDLESHYEGYGRNDYLSPITVKRYNELLDSFEKYRKTNKILDVGAGIGYFLEVAKKRGWEVYGTEFTDDAIEICSEKGIKMQKGDLSEGMFAKESFDIITSFEVIEHLSYPSEHVQILKSFLRQGGVFYITTPNFNSLLRRHLGQNWNVIAYPEHLSYFSRKSIKYLLKQNGFRNKFVKTQGISITRLKTSKRTSNQKFISASSDDEQIRISFERNKFKKILKKAINLGLSIFGVGDTLKAFAIKR